MPKHLPSAIPIKIPFMSERGFNYIKPIRITNRTTKLTEYQVEINLNANNFTFEKARSDGADIRFQDANGKVLNYWVESWNSTSAKIWVKIDELEDYEERFIYMNYGNFDAKSESSLDNVFIFGELWDSGALNTTRWPTVTGSPTYSINTTNKYLEITNINDAWNGGYGFQSKTILFPNEYMIEEAYGNGEFDLYIDSTVPQLTAIRVGVHHTTWSSSDFGIAQSALLDGVQASTHRREAGVGGNLDYTTAYGQGQIATVPFSIYKVGGNIKITYNTGIVVNEANSEVPDRFFIGACKISGYTFGTVRMYAFKIRKYASTPPLVEVL